MSDIVERLRFRADENYEMLANIHEPLLEAADEITRLRAEAENQVQWVRDLADNLIAEEAKTATLRARVAELEEALREIAAMDEVAIVKFKKGEGWLHQRVARAALTKAEGKT